MGLSDIAPSFDKSEEELKKLYIVTIYKEQNNDVMAVHRGMLGIIKLKQNSSNNFTYETQILCGE